MAEDKADTPRGYIKQVLGLDSSGVNNINNFLEALAEIESSGGGKRKNNYLHGSNKKSSAGGYFQFLNANGPDGGFDGSSLDTAFTRLKRIFRTKLGKELPKRFADAYANKSVTGLGFDDQATLALINLQQIPTSTKNPVSTNALLAAVGRGDRDAARDLYRDFHLTQVNTGDAQFGKIGKKVKRVFGSWLKPVGDKNQAEADRIAAAEREDATLREMEAAGDKEPGFFDKLGQTGDIVGSMVGLGPDRERTVEAGDTAYGIAGDFGVDVKDLGGVGDDPDVLNPGDVLTAPAKTWEEEFEELKRVWGLYEGGIVDRADVSARIYNIMKPRN